MKYSERQDLIKNLDEPNMVCTPLFIKSGERFPCIKDECMAFKYSWNESSHTCFEGTNHVIPDISFGRRFWCELLEQEKMNVSATARSSIL